MRCMRKQLIDVHPYVLTIAYGIITKLTKL